MSHTILLFHIVFRTKYNVPAIGHENSNDLYRFIWDFCKDNNCILYRVGGMPDHVHILVQIPAAFCISDFVQRLKVSTNFFIKNNPGKFPAFQGWNRAYYAASCSESHIPVIKTYIANQRKHHEQEDMISEFRRLTSCKIK